MRPARVHRIPVCVALLALTCVFPAASFAGDATNDTAEAQLRDRAGKEVGAAQLVQTPNGVLIRVNLNRLPPGPHAFHIHQTGECIPPFKSAGAHFNPLDKSHGFESPNGWHAGDLPNLFVNDDGTAKVEVFVPGLSLQSKDHPLLDSDGAALVLHDHADDQRTDPAGDAGDRIACGVVQAKAAPNPGQ